MIHSEVFRLSARLLKQKVCVGMFEKAPIHLRVNSITVKHTEPITNILNIKQIMFTVQQWCIKVCN